MTSGDNMLGLCDPSNLLFKYSFYPLRSDALFSNYFEDLLIYVADILNGRLLLSIKSTCTCYGKEMIEPSDLPPEFLAYGIQV